MTTSPRRGYSGHCKNREEEGDPRTPERSGARNVDSGLQEQMKKDRCSSTRQS